MIDSCVTPRGTVTLFGRGMWKMYQLSEIERISAHYIGFPYYLPLAS